MTGVKTQHVIIVRIVAVRMVLIILGSPGLALKRVEMNVNLDDMVSNVFRIRISHISFNHVPCIHGD